MIASVQGVVQGFRDASVIVSVGGVGLEVFVPTDVFNELSTQLGEPVSFETYLSVKEDSLTLYGFRHAEERRLFELLLKVNGVGPSTALSVMSTLTPQTLAAAITDDKPEIIARAPGLGKKTAQKVILELKGKVLPEGLPPGIAAVTNLDTDVIEYLTALGFSIVEAQAAVQSIPKDAPDDVSERVRIALTYFDAG